MNSVIKAIFITLQCADAVIGLLQWYYFNHLLHLAFSSKNSQALLLPNMVYISQTLRRCLFRTPPQKAETYFIPTTYKITLTYPPQAAWSLNLLSTININSHAVSDKFRHKPHSVSRLQMMLF